MKHVEYSYKKGTRKLSHELHEGFENPAQHKTYGLRNQYLPFQVEIINKNTGKIHKIRDVACGNDHTLVGTEEGYLYTNGNA